METGIEIFILLLITLSGIAVLTKFSTLHFGIKVVLIPALIFSSIVSFLMLQEYLGKPVSITSIPSEVVVYGQRIEKDKGLIYLLMSLPGDPPPAKYISFEYHQGCHKALVQGRKQSKGAAFILKTEDIADKPGGNGKAGKKGTGKKGKDGNISLSEESISFSAHDLPPPILPPKNLEETRE